MKHKIQNLKQLSFRTMIYEVRNLAKRLRWISQSLTFLRNDVWGRRHSGKRSASRVCIFVLLFASLFIAHDSSVLAQTSLPLKAAPTVQEITLTPGEATQTEVRFFNDGDSLVTGFIGVSDFVVQDNKGTPVLIDDFQQTPPKYMASQWFNLLYDKAVIPAHSKLSVPITIQSPVSAKPGGRYVAAFFEPNLNVASIGRVSNSAVSGTSARIATLFYIKIPGEYLEKALISRLFAPSFFENGPINVESEILNRGDYHIRPKALLTMTNMFDGAVDQKKLTELNIFPDRSRGYTTSIGTKWMIGRYRIDLAATYGDKGQALTRSIYVWVFPWKIALLIVLTIILLMIGGKHVYKKYILREAVLEKELEREQKEIEELKRQIKKREE